jgi:3-hydroxyacyl-[acyl-carrier-protein] dehydratase
MNSSIDPGILQQVQAILRRDLKLAANEPLPEDMPFTGSEVDLDSLDMLLLLTSLERQFGIKIPSQAVGEQVFQSVGSLARYVQEHHVPVPTAPAPSSPPVDWLAQLPHGPEFRFVSRVLEVRPGESARGVWELTGTESFFGGHFPGNPVVPGALIAEALAQMTGLAAPAGSGAHGKLAHLDIRFEESVSPPVEIELTAKMLRVLGHLQMCDVTAQVGPRIVARGSITLHRGGASK